MQSYARVTTLSWFGITNSYIKEGEKGLLSKKEASVLPLFRTTVKLNSGSWKERSCLRRQDCFLITGRAFIIYGLVIDLVRRRRSKINERGSSARILVSSKVSQANYKKELAAGSASNSHRRGKTELFFHPGMLARKAWNEVARAVTDESEFEQG